MNHDTRVLILGADATGLTLACELLRREVHCRVIDTRAECSADGPAVLLHPASCEILAGLRVAGPTTTGGTRLRGATLRHGGRVLAAVDQAGDGAPAGLLVLPREELEQSLRARVHALGGTVEHSPGVAAITDEGDGISVALYDADGRRVRRVRAGWLVRCDPAPAPARTRRGASRPAPAHDGDLVVGETDADLPLPRDRCAFWIHGSGVLAAYPMPGGHRWQLVAALPRHGVTTPGEAMLALLREAVAGLAIGDPTTPGATGRARTVRAARYLADRMREGRVFYAGEAAHGFGPLRMHDADAGIQDAHNLAWKLAAVAKGAAAEEILDTYEDERLPVARDLLARAEAIDSLRPPGGPLSALWRRGALESFLRGSLGGGAAYPDSPLSLELPAPRMWSPRRTPRAGEPAPDAPVQTFAGRETTLTELMRGTQLTLLLFGGVGHGAGDAASLERLVVDVEGRLGGLVQTYWIFPNHLAGYPAHPASSTLVDADGEARSRYGVSEPTAFLVRPDGRVGLRVRGDRTHAAIPYLARWFRAYGRLRDPVRRRYH